MKPSNEEIEQMIERLESDSIDDPEDILNWFAMVGPALLREVLQGRKKV